MRVCKYCGVQMNDNEINCPLCGAHTDVVDATVPMVSGSYPQKSIRKPAKQLVRDIFFGISAVTILGFLIASFVSDNWSLIAISGTAVTFTWLAILQYIFYPHNTRQILGGIFTYLIIFTNLICLHFFFHEINGSEGINALNVSIGIVSPILLAVLNVVFLMIVFIGGNWYRYAFQTITLAIIEILWFVMTMLIPEFNFVASIVCASLGILTIVFSFVFGREVMAAEFRKRFHF